MIVMIVRVIILMLMSYDGDMMSGIIGHSGELYDGGL